MPEFWWMRLDLVFTLLCCSSGVLFCSFVWNIIPYLLILSNIVCGLCFSSCEFVVPLASVVCPLVGDVGPGDCAGFW